MCKAKNANEPGTFMQKQGRRKRESWLITRPTCTMYIIKSIFASKIVCFSVCVCMIMGYLICVRYG